jgi:hypothetical protein
VELKNPVRVVQIIVPGFENTEEATNSDRSGKVWEMFLERFGRVTAFTRAVDRHEVSVLFSAGEFTVHA